MKFPVLSVLLLLFSERPVGAQSSSSSAVSDAIFSSGNVFTWTPSKTVLPTPISDHTTNLVGNQVYIAGGCNDTDGNVYNVSTGVFTARSIGNNFWMFDVETHNITILPDLPTPRYRHAATAVNGQIWIMGGRDVVDNIITTVDAFDIASQTWHSFTDLPHEYYCSDNSAFSHNDSGLAIFVGGYNHSYGMLGQTVAIHAASSWASKKLNITQLASLNIPRGDHDGAIDRTQEYAMVSGGFGPQEGFCAPLNSTERYDVATNTWTIEAPMDMARSDLVSVEMNGQIYNIGGERQVADICKIAHPIPGDLTIPVNLVEVYHLDENQWQTLSNFPNYRFRWAAVGIDATNTIITFGGQVPFNQSCMCLKTSDQIGFYVLNTGGSSGNSTSTGTNTSGTVSARQTVNGAMLCTMLLVLWTVVG